MVVACARRPREPVGETRQLPRAPQSLDHTFASCQACEWKGWSKQGGEVPLGKVLALASERRF